MICADTPSANDRLNFSGIAMDERLKLIQCVVGNEMTVANFLDVTTRLRGIRLGDAPESGRTLDLIGHSATTENLLVIGAETVDPRREDMKRRLIDMLPILTKLSVTSIRLLGCSTAINCGWLNDMNRLLEPITVFGTTVPLSKRHFDDHGLKATANVLSSYAIPPPQEEITKHFDLIMEPFVPGQLIIQDPIAGLPRLELGDPALTPLPAWLTDFVDFGRQWSAPGLLAYPQGEILLRVQNVADRFRRLEVLLSYQLVRAYPPGHARDGVLYEVKEPAAFAAQLGI